MIYQVYENIDFETFDEPVGALISGGVDSSLMLYFLLKYHRKPLHLFTVVSEEKKYKNPMAAIGIIARCARLTGNYEFQHHMTYVEIQDNENLFDLPTKFINNGAINWMYTGVTKNPPDDVVKRFADENTEHVSRDPNQVRETKIGRYYRPWTNLNKADIAKIYKHHGLIDPLFKYTRSCEGTEAHLVFEDDLAHCGKCWWCEERIWGFGSINGEQFLA